MPDLKGTAEAYAQHVGTAPEPKAPMGSEYAATAGVPERAEAATERSHAADSAERAEDFAKRFPGIEPGHLAERENPPIPKGPARAQAIKDAEEARERNARNGQVAVDVTPGRLDQHAAAQAPAHRKYACGCTAWVQPGGALEDLPADCPTHSIPEPKEAA